MADAQQRQALLRKLAAARPLDDPTAFVLLWTYFEAVGLSDVENNFYLLSFRPETVTPIPSRTDDPAYDTDRTRALLAKKKHESDFDPTAAAWLKGLDRLLATQRGTFENATIEGYDGRQYRIRQMTNVIAGYFSHHDREPPDEEPTHHERAKDRSTPGNKKRSLSLSAYCRRFRVVPTEVKGIRIEGTSKWGDPSVHDRLQRAVEFGIRFLSWPLRYELHAERWTAMSAAQETTGRFVRVSVAAEPKARHRELSLAIQTAKNSQATILILPELSTATDDLPVLQKLLEDGDFDDYPILTVVGLEHQHDGRSNINEAVILGPDGTVLCRHKKLTRYPADDGSNEGITTGKTMHVLESPIGNLSPLICLDLFNEGIEPVITASHANVLLVPSLSGTTSAHERAAYRYMNINLATTIVCNRWFPEGGFGDRGREETFSLFPGKSTEGKTLFLQITAGGDFLLATVE
ncbi:MAG TPA: nitrilase-related carbon-nitrogen hydrolase [Thermoanaerobaculia bacterium]|nr:nitrilase-related carbon-nitrogen hydrolase [Thermoanaerobaculia bacterium]